MVNLTRKKGQFLLTALFDTVIAIVLFVTVLDHAPFWDVFVVSQITGLSICTFISVSSHFTNTQEKLLSPIMTIACLIAGILVSAMISGIYLFGIRDIPFEDYLKDTIFNIFIFGSVFGVPIAYFFATQQKMHASEKQIQQEKIQRLTMEKEATLTTLRLLQAQIEPHFLFNTLSNVTALLDTDIANAKKMLTHFNNYLRVCLQRTRQEKVTLSEELELVIQYLEICKIRFGSRIRYTISDETQNPQLPFPPLMIQPLVENSIKYGLEPLTEGGTITINCRIEADMLEVEISDTGVGLDRQGIDGTNAGIGINNVSRRLETIYGSTASLELFQNRPSGVTALIKVPL